MVKQKFTIMENELPNVMCLLRKSSVLPKKSYYKYMEKSKNGNKKLVKSEKTHRAFAENV